MYHKKYQMSTGEIKINLKSFGVCSKILIMENGVIGWINGQLREREWSMRQLAKKAGLSQTQVSNVLAGKRTVTRDFCVVIARAFGEPPEKILRLANLLPPAPVPAQGEDDLLAVFRQLSKQQRQYVLDSLRGLTSQPKPPNAAQAIEPEPAEIVIPDRDEGTVPEPEEMIDLLKMLDETERYFVYDYILWRLTEMQHRRNSSGRKRAEQEHRREHGEAIEIINLMLAIEEADPVRIEQVISWLQKQKTQKEERQTAAGPETSNGQ